MTNELSGSLTILATVLTDTGSRMDEVICEEFRGKANSEIVLSAELAELHVYPAIDIAHTTTNREPQLLEPDERRRLTEGWNDTATAYPREQGLAALFEARVRATPGSSHQAPSRPRARGRDQEVRS